MPRQYLPRATERLVFRHVLPTDRDTLRRLNADPRVMRYFPSVMGEKESDSFLERIFDHRKRFGFGLWALEERQSGAFVGLCGLLNFQIRAPFAPAIELGYRLNPDFQGKGLASEAARETLRYGFEDLGLEEIVSFTAEINTPSWRVMERIGMRHDGVGDFDHPDIPEGHPLRRHVLYRLNRDTFRSLPPLPVPGSPPHPETETDTDTRSLPDTPPVGGTGPQTPPVPEFQAAHAHTTAPEPPSARVAGAMPPQTRDGKPHHPPRPPKPDRRRGPLRTLLHWLITPGA